MDARYHQGSAVGFFDRADELTITDDEGEEIPPVRLAADVALAGMDPLSFLETDDAIQVMVMHAVASHYFKRREQLDERLAYMIIEKLGEAIK